MRVSSLDDGTCINVLIYPLSDSPNPFAPTISCGPGREISPSIHPPKFFCHHRFEPLAGRDRFDFHDAHRTSCVWPVGHHVCSGEFSDNSVDLERASV